MRKPSLREYRKSCTFFVVPPYTLFTVPIASIVFIVPIASIAFIVPIVPIASIVLIVSIVSIVSIFYLPLFFVPRVVWRFRSLENLEKTQKNPKSRKNHVV